MNWEIYLTDHAKKQIKKIPNLDLEKIESVIDDMASNPFFGDIQKLKNESNVWRRRVGNYRIIYEITIEVKKIFIYEIKRRASKTYK